MQCQIPRQCELQIIMAFNTSMDFKRDCLIGKRGIPTEMRNRDAISYLGLQQNRRILQIHCDPFEHLDVMQLSMKKLKKINLTLSGEPFWGSSISSALTTDILFHIYGVLDPLVCKNYFTQPLWRLCGHLCVGKHSVLEPFSGILDI